MGLDAHAAICDDACMPRTDRIAIAPRIARDASGKSPEGVICPEPKGNAQMATTFTPKEIALQFGTSPKKLRKFLRSTEAVKVLGDAAHPGKGARYAIQAKSVKPLKARFIAWNALNGTKAPEAPKPTRTRTKPAKPAEAVIADEAPIEAEAPEAPAEG